MRLAPGTLQQIVRAALQEDAAFHDVTTQAIVPKNLHARAVLLAKQDLVLCGMPLAVAAFRALDPKVRVQGRYPEGARVKKGTAFAVLVGKARALLSAERIALNFL